MRYWIAAAVVLIAAFAALAYVRTAPQTVPTAATRLDVQTVGDSKAGRAQEMPPRQAADQAGSDETGKRAQTITGTGSGESPLSQEQRSKIASYFAEHQAAANRVENGTFGVAIGASVPRQVDTQPLPPELVDVMEKYRGDEYVISGNQLLVVEPKVRRIVAIVPLQ